MPILSTPGGEFRDEIREPIYDTVDLQEGEGVAGKRTFFTSISGAGGVPKSLAKTNLKTVGQLPVATSYRVQGLQLDAQNTLAANAPILSLIVDRSSLSFQVGEKVYWYGPSRFAAGRITTDLAAQAALIHQQMGWSATQAIMFKGHHVININSLQNFFVDWTTELRDLTTAEAALTVAADTVLPVVFSLKGLLRRAVQ